MYRLMIAAALLLAACAPEPWCDGSSNDAQCPDGLEARCVYDEDPAYNPWILPPVCTLPEGRIVDGPGVCGDEWLRATCEPSRP